VLAIGWAGMLVCKIFQVEASSAYFSALLAIIFFTIVNTVISISYKSYLRYTIPSYYIYIALVIILLQSAKLSSGISIWKLTEYRMMLVSVTLFYFIASVLVRIIRIIYDAVESGF
jgi:hypothetical protein